MFGLIDNGEADRVALVGGKQEMPSKPSARSCWAAAPCPAVGTSFGPIAFGVRSSCARQDWSEVKQHSVRLPLPHGWHRLRVRFDPALPGSGIQLAESN